MPAPISILEATEPDVPTMVAIFCDAMEEDILTLFLNGHRRVDAVRRQTETLTTVLGRRFTHPTNRCHIIKAVDTQTGELVGWSLLRWEDGIKPDAPTESGLEQRDFRVFYGGEQKKKMFGLTEGKEHIGKTDFLPFKLLRLKESCVSARRSVRETGTTWAGNRKGAG